MEGLATGIEVFDRITGGIPKGKVILVEEEFGRIKSLFAQQIAFNLAKKRKNGKTLYITQRSREEIEEEMKMYGMELVESIDIESLDKLSLKICNDYDLVIIEGFSILFYGLENKEIIDFISGLKKIGATVLILSDMGILEKRKESILRAVVDGVIQFRFRDNMNRIERSIIIPKFSRIVDEVLPFKVESSGIVVDTRRRVG